MNPILRTTLPLVLALASSTSRATTLPEQTAPKPNEEMQAVLDAQDKLGAKPIETLTPDEARKQPSVSDAAKSILQMKGIQPENGTKTKTVDTIIAEPKNIPVRVYRPVGDNPSLPVIVYYHGGGFVLGSKDVYDSSARALSSMAKAMVISVDYRLAPENKFPTAIEDSFTAYQWVVKNAEDLGGNPNKIAIAGESAGGNLAINVAIRARDAGIKTPVHELLVYPFVSGDLDLPSKKEFANAKPLNTAMLRWFFENYLVSMDQTKDPRINVVKANLQGLPTTTLISAQIDPLRSDSEELLKSLQQQGVTVHYREFKGVTHEFFGLGSVVKEAKEAEDFAAQELQAAFNRKRAE